MFHSRSGIKGRKRGRGQESFFAGFGHRKKEEKTFGPNASPLKRGGGD